MMFLEGTGVPCHLFLIPISNSITHSPKEYLSKNDSRYIDKKKVMCYGYNTTYLRWLCLQQKLITVSSVKQD